MSESITDPDGLKSVIRGLLSSWATEGGQVTLGQEDRSPDPGRFIGIHSLAAHVHRLADAALILTDAARPLEAMPIVRSAYESAITAMWLAQSEDGGRAWMHEFSRQQRAVQQTLSKSENPIFADGVDLPHVDAPGFDSNSKDQARLFHRLCDDFEGGVDLYIYYRLMCAYSHPGVRLVEKYVVANEDRTDVAALTNVPRFDGAMWLYFVAASLVWAGSAFDHIDVTHPRRSDLARAADAIGVASDLHLTQAAQARG